MTKRKQLILLLGTLFFLCFNTIASAAVQKGISKNIKTEGTPLDIAVSAEGKNTFVLLEGGLVQILGINGRSEGTIEVSKSAVGIDVSPRGDMIFLADRDKKSIEIVALDHIININIAGSPFKGPVDAPVIIAEFSDYQ